MAEYIERDAFIKRLENEADRSSGIIDLLILNGIANIVRDNNIAPAVDVVKVVRCNDCYYYSENKGICTNTACVKSFYGCKVNPDDFCSYGERKCEE